MKLIKISTDHYIIVDDSEIKEGDCYIKLDNNLMFSTLKGSNPHIVEKYCKKITHSTQPFNCNCSNKGYRLNTNCAERNHCFDKIQYLSHQEVKELIGEVDLEKKANEAFPIGTWSSDAVALGFDMYKIGYNQALEDNKDKKYTEEDMKVAITQAFLSGLERLEDFERVQEMILDNIKPKTEWEVEFDENGKLILV